MNDLVTWLRAQLDEDERVARALQDPGFTQAPGPWRYSVRMDFEGIVDSNGHDVIRFKHHMDPMATVVTHVLGHDPARVLREVAAKRAIVDEANLYLCDAGMMCGYRTKHGHNTLLHLAAVYSDRDGYRPEWAPDPSG